MEAFYVPHFRTPVTYATRRVVGKFTSCRLPIVGLCISSFIPVFLSPPSILILFIYFSVFSYVHLILLHYLHYFTSPVHTFIYSFPSIFCFLLPQSCIHSVFHPVFLSFFSCLVKFLASFVVPISNFLILFLLASLSLFNFFTYLVLISPFLLLFLTLFLSSFLH